MIKPLNGWIPVLEIWVSHWESRLCAPCPSLASSSCLVPSCLSASGHEQSSMRPQHTKLPTLGPPASMQRTVFIRYLLSRSLCKQWKLPDKLPGQHGLRLCPSSLTCSTLPCLFETAPVFLPPGLYSGCNLLLRHYLKITIRFSSSLSPFGGFAGIPRGDP